MKTLLEKLNNAKVEIKNTKVKKRGWNDYSKYEYFTPDQIEHLVSLACVNNNLLTTFETIRNELGIYGELSIYDIESAKCIKLKMATDIPSIKATNIAQQLGGCVTYTERYLKMSAFGITDNQLDFDTTPNTKKQINSPEITEAEKKENWIKVIQGIKKTVKDSNNDWNEFLIQGAYDNESVLIDCLPGQRKMIKTKLDAQVLKLKEQK